MEFPGAAGLHTGGYDQPDKRKVFGRGPCPDPEGAHPITPIRIDKESRQITLAYFEQKSTVDYIGAIQGLPVCFDAKECAADTFALQNIHAHQVSFMEKFEKQGGISFFLIYYTHKDIFYYLPLQMLLFFWNRAKEGGRKSFRYEELNPEYVLPRKHGILVPYLDILQKDLEDRA